MFDNIILPRSNGARPTFVFVASRRQQRCLRTLELDRQMALTTSRRRYVLFCAAFVGVFCFWLLSSTATQRNQRNVDLLAVTESDLNLGTVLARSDLSWTIHLRNTGNTDIFIDRIHRSCACLTSAEAPRSIAPNGEGVISLSIDLASDAGSSARREYHEFAATIVTTIRAADRVYQKVLPLRGRVQEWCWTSEANVDFGPNLIRGQQSISKRIDVDTLSIDHLIAKITPPIGYAVVMPVDEQLGRYQIDLTLDTLQQVDGKISGQLELIGLSSTGELIGERRLSLNGEFVPDIVIEPMPLILAASTGGGASEETVRVLSRSGAPLADISVVEQIGNGIEISVLSASVSPSNSFLVRVMPLSNLHGITQARVRFSARSTLNNEELSISLPVIYKAL